MSESMSVQWFPGHMAKTRRKIAEDLKLVDVVAELLDARVPSSSANPVLREIIRNKPRVVVLNKSDLADPGQTARWTARFREQGLAAVPVESKTGKGLPGLYSAIRQELKEQIAGWERKGMTGRPIRVMVLGVPNVGKSSIINRMITGGRAGKAEVREDGVLLRTLDPRAVNWTHCHAALLFQGTETRRHKIEISMAPADEEKTFTILGFGFVP